MNFNLQKTVIVVSLSTIILLLVFTLLFINGVIDFNKVIERNKAEPLTSTELTEIDTKLKELHDYPGILISETSYLENNFVVFGKLICDPETKLVTLTSQDMGGVNFNARGDILTDFAHMDHFNPEDDYLFDDDGCANGNFEISINTQLEQGEYLVDYLTPKDLYQESYDELSLISSEGRLEYLESVYDEIKGNIEQNNNNLWGVLYHNQINLLSEYDDVFKFGGNNLPEGGEVQQDLNFEKYNSYNPGYLSLLLPTTSIYLYESTGNDDYLADFDQFALALMKNSDPSKLECLKSIDESNFDTTDCNIDWRWDEFYNDSDVNYCRAVSPMRLLGLPTIAKHFCIESLKAQQEELIMRLSNAEISSAKFRQEVNKLQANISAGQPYESDFLLDLDYMPISRDPQVFWLIQDFLPNQYMELNTYTLALNKFNVFSEFCTDDQSIQNLNEINSFLNVMTIIAQNDRFNGLNSDELRELVSNCELMSDVSITTNALTPALILDEKGEYQNSLANYIINQSNLDHFYGIAPDQDITSEYLAIYKSKYNSPPRYYLDDQIDAIYLEYNLLQGLQDAVLRSSFTDFFFEEMWL